MKESEKKPYTGMEESNTLWMQKEQRSCSTRIFSLLFDVVCIDGARHCDMDSEADLQKRISHEISVYGSDRIRMSCNLSAVRLFCGSRHRAAGVLSR